MIGPSEPNRSKSKAFKPSLTYMIFSQYFFLRIGLDSITLIAAAFGAAPDGLWFPPLVETLIAVSIVYMALENIVGSKLRRRWLIACAFGLVYPVQDVVNRLLLQPIRGDLRLRPHAEQLVHAAEAAQPAAPHEGATMSDLAISTLADAQRDMRSSYRGGLVGQIVDFRSSREGLAV